MATTSDFKNGLCMKFNNGLYTIVQFQHVKPGKGPAFVRTKLKNLDNGRVVENTFTAGVKIESVRIENRSYQFLYRNGTTFHFMNTESFEQISLEEKQVGNADLFKEEQIVSILFHAEEEIALNVELPAHIILEVVYTEPGVRGDTTSSTVLKPAKVETGAELNVPNFINQGDKIKIDTRTRNYIERVKE